MASTRLDLHQRRPPGAAHTGPVRTHATGSRAMFDSADLDHVADKARWQREEPRLREALL
jgi:hypothetical protein